MPTQLQAFTALLQVFYFGLTHGIVSKKEIAAWADSIILTEDEPDYFFIELSTASDKNELRSVISNAVDTALTQLSARAVLGLICHCYEAGTIDIEKAISLCSSLPSREVLTSLETSEIYDFESDFYTNNFVEDDFDGDRHDRAIGFLDRYTHFKLDNFTEWEELNTRIDKLLHDNVMAHQQWAEHWRLEDEQRQAIYNKDVKLYKLISYGLAAVSFFFAGIGPSLLESEQQPSNLFSFIWVASALYFTFFVCYHIVLGIRFVLRNLFPQYF